jgi:hypothetical protein
VPSSVDATVISAFATTHGISVATSGTAALDASPTPPPNRTNLAKDPNAFPPTGRACDEPERTTLRARTADVGAEVSNFCI